MPEHVHLLVSEPREAPLSLGSVAAERTALLAGAVLRLQRVVAQKQIEKLRYIHRSPVARGLVAKPEDWPWSSYAHYANGVEGVVEVESQWVAFRRGNRSPEAFRHRDRAD